MVKPEKRGKMKRKRGEKESANKKHEKVRGNVCEKIKIQIAYCKNQ